MISFLKGETTLFKWAHSSMAMPESHRHGNLAYREDPDAKTGESEIKASPESEQVVIFYADVADYAERVGNRLRLLIAS